MYMTVHEAVKKMEDTLLKAQAELSGFGLDMSIEFDYMNIMFKSVDSPEKARFITASLVISCDGINKGDEYCLSLGVDNKKRGVSEAQLDKDIAGFGEMVRNTLKVIAEHSSPKEALELLTAEATAEFEKVVSDIKKNNNISRIINIAFAVGIVVFFIIAVLLR